jgi:exopolysaccharide production protein ExoY
MHNKIIKYVSIFIFLLVLAPLFLFIIIIIYFDSGRPLFHYRESVGLNESTIFVIKFRTMKKDADEILNRWEKENKKYYTQYSKHNKLKKDPRVTKIGKYLRKYSLDELPQLINVLKGEMNLVGPRPITEQEAKIIDVKTMKIRTSVRPGMTGLWQVNGRQETSFQERIKLDVEYVNNRSIWNDFIIIIKTIPSVLFSKGAY